MPENTKPQTEEPAKHTDDAIAWTDEQLEAITSHDRGIVVPAAAGSGKTAVLIERTVRLLEKTDVKERIPAEKLMAVTFSRNAAEQLRSKLRKALTERMTEDGLAPETREWLSRQQDMLPLAKISTINSFCLGIVRDNLAGSDYRSGLRICDEIQADALITESIEDVREAFCEQYPERYELLIDAFTNNDESRLGDIVKKLYRFRRSLAFPALWTENALERLSDSAHCDELFLSLCRKYKPLFDSAAYLPALVTATVKKLPKPEPPKVKKKSTAKPLADIALEDEGKYSLLHSEITSAIASLSAGGERANDLGRKLYGRVYEAFRDTTFGRMTIKATDIPPEKLDEFEAVKAEIQKLREEMKEPVGKFKDMLIKLGPDPYGSMKNSRDIFSALSDFTDMVEVSVRDKKLDDGLAEFGDIERMAMELLVELDENGIPRRTPLAEGLRDSDTYMVMLIDEYQDVNNLEEMIFRALSKTDSLDNLGRNVFVVGDIKQSIYRFRQANPLLFREAVRAANSEECGDLREIRLRNNFRSRRNILDFVNMVFTRLMTPELGEVEYNEGEMLRYGASYQGEDPPVTLIFPKLDQPVVHDASSPFDSADPDDADTDTDSESGDDGDENEGGLKYYTFDEEELAVAIRIKRILDEGTPVADKKTSRPCRPSDFCVLTRNNAGCQRVAEALAYVGLRAESEQADGYLGSREIAVMVNLLRVIDNRMHDNALASVMLSPIMSFGASDLARLRMLCFDKYERPSKHLSQIIDTAARGKAEGIDEELSQKCLAAQQFLDKLSFLALSMTLEELISYIYEETDLFAAASASRSPAQRRANLRLLTQYAAEYERDMTGGISGFLRYLDSVTASDNDFKQAVTVTAGEDAVCVKTFHRSKGLEYPFVFIALLGKQFNDSDKKAPLLLSEAHGAGIKYMVHEKLMKVETLAHDALTDIVWREQLSEELRLFYVALTRAKEHLFISASLKEKPGARNGAVKRIGALADRILSSGGLTPSLLADCRSPLDWICCALLLTDMRRPVLERLGMEESEAEFAAISPSDEAPAVMEYEIAGSSDAAAEKEELRRPAPDESVVAMLKERYAFRFPDEETRAPAKRTVTEIVREIQTADNGDEHTDKMFFPQIGSLDEGAERLSAAQKGTYTHLFMQLADYANAERDAEAELRALTQAGRFTEREAKGVYIDAVKKFFRSELYKRMKRSERIDRELKFMVKASDAKLDGRYMQLISPDGMIQGVCDCVFREEDGYVLVDYKTDNFGSESELDKYSVQLELYKAALDLILPMPVKECCIYSFKLGVYREITMQL